MGFNFVKLLHSLLKFENITVAKSSDFTEVKDINVSHEVNFLIALLLI